MTTLPIGSFRAEALEAALPAEHSGATGPGRRTAHSGPPLLARNAVPGPPPPRGTLPARLSAAKKPGIQALQQLDRIFDALPLRPVDVAADDSERGATRAVVELALRIARQRPELPRDEAVRAISDMKFVRIMATASMRKQEVLVAATAAYDTARMPLYDQMDVGTATYMQHAATLENATGQARHVALVAGIDQAGRVAAQAQDLVMLNHGMQQHCKEQIALCEATLTARWKLEAQAIRTFEDTLMTTRLQQFNLLSQQVHDLGKLLLWSCVNPHPQVFAGLEIKELLPVVEKLTTCDILASRGRAGPSPPSLAPDRLSAQEQLAVDGIRIAAADGAAYMASLADRVGAGSGLIFTGQSDKSIRDLAIACLRDLEATGWELAGMASSLLPPAQPQAAEPSARETPHTQAKRRPRHKARGKRPSAAPTPTRPVGSRDAEAAPVVRSPVKAQPPALAGPLPAAPTAQAARDLVSQLAALLEAQDPRPAQLQELQQLRKVSAPEKVVSTMQDLARAWEIQADKLRAAHDRLKAHHLLLLHGDELRQASSLKDRAAAMAADLQGEAQALTRNLDQARHDLMKTYLLPEQAHWDELLDTRQARIPRPPRALPVSPPDTLFEVELQPAPLTGRNSPPPSVWLHLHTHQATTAAELASLPPQAFAAMHLKSTVERRRGRNWLAEQASKGVPTQMIHRGKVDKHFVAKVLAKGREMQVALLG